MLYPRENRVRGVIDLGGVWNFKLGDEKEPGDSFVMGEDTELMAVPASYNDQKDDPKYRNHYGWAYYERKITVPSYLKGQRLVLRFDAVTHAAKVYLNGRFLTAHKGGFLPFEVDVTDQLVPGETAELVVAADNRVNHSTLPVGMRAARHFSDRTIRACRVLKRRRYGENRRICRILISLIMLESTVRSASIRRRRLILRTLRWCRILTAIPEW